MGDWLERFRNSEVEIHYLTDNNAYKDRGQLVDFGEGWLELLKPGPAGAKLERGETFAIPVSSVRIMKILHPASATAEENHLLRPVEFQQSGLDVERRQLGDERIEQEIRSG